MTFWLLLINIFFIEVNISQTYLIKCPTSNKLPPRKKENSIGTQPPSHTPPQKLKKVINLSAQEDHQLLLSFFKLSVYGTILFLL